MLSMALIPIAPESEPDPRHDFSIAALHRTTRGESSLRCWSSTTRRRIAEASARPESEGYRVVVALMALRHQGPCGASPFDQIGSTQRARDDEAEVQGDPAGRLAVSLLSMAKKTRGHDGSRRPAVGADEPSRSRSAWGCGGSKSDPRR
jgi:hypothetical protein